MSENKEENKVTEQDAVTMHLRNVLLKDTNEKYHAFCDAIKKLPIPVQCYVDGLKQMDFGMLWIKEAITFSPIVLPDQKKEADVIDLKNAEIMDMPAEVAN